MKITLKQREEIIRAFFENVCLPILSAKGKDSSIGDDFDLLTDSKSGHAKWRVWWDLVGKHIIRLKRWVMTGEAPSEGLIPTLADIINYMFILVAELVCEDKIRFEGCPYSRHKRVEDNKHNLDSENIEARLGSIYSRVNGRGTKPPEPAIAFEGGDDFDLLLHQYKLKYMQAVEKRIHALAVLYRGCGPDDEYYKVIEDYVKGLIEAEDVANDDVEAEANINHLIWWKKG